MRCSKCWGLMSFEQFMNVASEALPWSYKGWRCIECGEIIDFVILLNRMNSRTAIHGRTDMKDKVLEEEGTPVGAGDTSH